MRNALFLKTSCALKYPRVLPVCSGNLILGMLLTFLFVPDLAFGQSGMPGTPAGFEIDGNFHNNSADDWVSALDLGVDCPLAGKTLLEATWVVDDIWAGNLKDVSTFTEGAKNPDNLGPGQMLWMTTEGSGPRKNDLTNTFFHTRMDESNNLWFVFGAETRAANGDSHLDWEFNQAGLSYDPDDGTVIGNGPVGGRTIGDLLVVANYENGGGAESLELFVWNEDAPGSTTGHWEAIPLTDDGTTYLVVNTTEIPALCGTSSFQPGGGPSASSIPLQFAEGAINLTAFNLAPADPCLADATIMVKTRTSPSFTSALADFVLFAFPGATPSEVLAGDDQGQCQDPSGTNSFQLDGYVDSGNATWTVLNTMGSIVVEINDPELLNSTVDIEGIGSVEIELSVEDAGGCSEGTDVLTLSVYSDPVAAFTADDGCEGHEIQFVNNSTPGSNPGDLSYFWEFGDGTTSVEENPVHIFSEDGQYTVFLTLSQDDGSGAVCSDVTSLEVTIYPSPDASFTVENGCAGDPIQFVITSTQETDDGVSALLDLDAFDLLAKDDSGQNEPSGMDLEEVVPVVTVRLSNPQIDCENGATYCLDVEFKADIPDQQLFGVNVRFFYDDHVLEFLDFRDFQGDYIPVTPNPPEVVTSLPGVGPFLFGFGGPAEFVNGAIQLEEDGAPPIILATDSWTKCFQICFTVDDPNPDPDNFCPSIVWDLEEDPLSGGFITGDDGVVITVLNPDPLEESLQTFENVVQHNWTYDGEPGEPFGFPVETSCVPYPCAPCTLTYAWDFGDGGSSSEENPIYTFTEAGEYVVTLTVTEDCPGGISCSTDFTQVVTVFDCNVIDLCFNTPGFWANQARKRNLPQPLLDANGGITIGDANAPCDDPFVFTTDNADCLDVLLPGPPFPNANNLSNKCGLAAGDITINSFLWHLIALTMNTYNHPGTADYLLGNLSCQIDYAGTGLGPDNTVQDLLDAANASYACGNYSSSFIEAMTTLDECTTGCDEEDFGGNALTQRGIYQEEESIMDFEVFPNPAMHSFFVRVNPALQEKSLMIGVYNSLGELVMQREISADAGGVIAFNSYQLPKGFYLVQVKGEEYSVAKKLLIE